MTAAVKNRNTPELNGLGNLPEELIVKNNAIIFTGTMLAIDASPEALEASDTAALQVVGRCPEYIDDSADSMTVNPEMGCFQYENDADNPVVAGDKIAYVHDNQTVCASAGSTNKIVAGLVISVTATKVWMNQTHEGLKLAQALHDAGAESASAHIANTAAAAGACAGGATPTATQVDTAIATAVAPLVTSINAILAALETQNVLKSS